MISQLTIAMYDTAAVRLFGSPDSASEPAYEEIAGDTVVRWYYDGLALDLTGHRISGIRCTRADCVTPDGIRIGTTRAAVQAAYGTGYSVRDDSLDIIVYGLPSWGCAFVVTFSQEKVTQLALRCAD